jgi:hypothetical protein
VSYFTRDLKDSAAECFVEHDAAGDRAASSDFSAGAVAGPEVELRTFRLALITDPSYATYHGADNVTAAKVTLLNRVNQIYETESAIRMVLIGDNDKRAPGLVYAGPETPYMERFGGSAARKRELGVDSGGRPTASRPVSSSRSTR